MGLLSTIIGIVPLVIDTVKTVETFFGAGNGSQKKQAVLSAVQDTTNIYDKLRGTNASSGDVTAAISELIDAVVKLNNALGVFTHAAAPAA